MGRQPVARPSHEGVMTWIDRWLQSWRLRKAIRFLQPGMRVLDLGSADGVLFERFGRCAPGSMGIDPTLDSDRTLPSGFLLHRGFFPQDMPPDAGPFDAVVMLAVLEHFPESQYRQLSDGVARLLRPGGRLILTVPHPAVDGILAVLSALRLVHGMSLQEHHGYAVSRTPGIFLPPMFRLVHRSRFQLGLNHLFVFERTDERPVGNRVER